MKKIHKISFAGMEDAATQHLAQEPVAGQAQHTEDENAARDSSYATLANMISATKGQDGAPDQGIKPASCLRSLYFCWHGCIEISAIDPVDVIILAVLYLRTFSPSVVVFLKSWLCVV